VRVHDLRQLGFLGHYCSHRRVAERAADQRVGRNVKIDLRIAAGISAAVVALDASKRSGCD